MNLSPNGSKKGRRRKRRRIAPTRRIRREEEKDKKRRIRRKGKVKGETNFLFHSLCGPVDRKKPLTWASQV
jgi:hypothetical protein